MLAIVYYTFVRKWTTLLHKTPHSQLNKYYTSLKTDFIYVLNKGHGCHSFCIGGHILAIPGAPHDYTSRVKHGLYKLCRANPRSIQAVSSTPQIYRNTPQVYKNHARANPKSTQVVQSTAQICTNRTIYTSGLYKPCQAYPWSIQAVPGTIQVYGSTLQISTSRARARHRSTHIMRSTHRVQTSRTW